MNYIKSLISCCIVTCLVPVSFNVFAIDFISHDERNELRLIESKYSYDDNYLRLNEQLSLHSSSVWDEANQIEAYNELSEYLKSKILFVDVDSSEFESIKKLINKRKDIKKELDSYKDLPEKYAKIKDDFKKLEYEKIILNNEKRKVMQKAISRIQKEIERDNISKSITGVTKCKVNENLNGCLSRNKSLIMEDIVDNNVFLTEGSDFIAFTYTDASINLDNVLSYTAYYEAKPLFNSSIYNELNKVFGFESARVNLKSNVNVDWFVDGKYVGKGTDISVTLPLGTHAILATFEGNTQSSIENVQSEKDYYYNLKRSQVNNNGPLVNNNSKTSSLLKLNALSDVFLSALTTDDKKKFYMITDKNSVPLLLESRKAIEYCSFSEKYELASLEDYKEIIESNIINIGIYNINANDQGTGYLDFGKDFIPKHGLGVSICSEV
ncbi:hypothetical protein [Vibrio sp. TBV020]|uniref:hypothetical protein n=1 Tax=Vibrio sp. TBV020 TaxID=3137398 RepID=UPI0038CD8476